VSLLLDPKGTQTIKAGKKKPDVDFGADEIYQTRSAQT
jgi:hypothetical protein